MYSKQQKETALKLFKENQSVSEDIGYSRASIYKWWKQYLKKGTLKNKEKAVVWYNELRIKNHWDI